MRNSDLETSSQDVPLYETGVDLGQLSLGGGERFWQEADRFTATAAVGLLLDRVISEGGARRVWAFLEAGPRDGGRVAAALAVARGLIERGHSVIVLDPDELQPVLTRWVGRSGQPGWIDHLRFGVSFPRCSVPLPWGAERGRFFGIGSFFPTGVTDAEVDRFLEGLPATVDDVLLPISMGPEAGRWIQRATVKFLCWDRMSVSAEEHEATVAESADRYGPITGVMAFGEGEKEILRALAVLEPAAAGPAVEVDIDFGSEPDRDRAQDPATKGLVPVLGVVSEAELASSPPDGLVLERPARSSRPFWILAALLLVTVVAMGALWGKSTFWPADTPDPDASKQELAQPDEPVDITPARTGSAQAEPPDAAAPFPAAPSPAIGATETLPVDPGQADTDEIEPAGQSETIRTTVAPVSDLLAGPVGEGGWALHVFSVAGPKAAEDQVAMLAEQGIPAISRVIQIPEKGRWYRIYVGHFSSRAEAAAAIGEVTRRIGCDWAMPARFVEP